VPENHREHIQFLVRRKYPASGVSRAPAPPSSFSSGSYVATMSSYAPEKDSRRAEIAKYAAQLSLMPSDEFTAFYELETAKFYEEESTRLQAIENARFFNLPYANADFDHWSRAAYWTLEEAVALSFGKNPEIVTWATIARWQNESGFALQFSRMLDLARRAVPWQQLFDPVSPGIFIGWARRNEIAFPQALEDAVRSRGNHIIDWKKTHDDLKKLYDASLAELAETRRHDLEVVRRVAAQRDDAMGQLDALTRAAVTGVSSDAALAPREGKISTREKDSLLRLVIGMAVKGYAYDPQLKRSERIVEIASDLEKTGVPLDADTVRKWLKAGAELLPAPVTE
jgi:hypothetical protein